MCIISKLKTSDLVSVIVEGSHFIWEEDRPWDTSKVENLVALGLSSGDIHADVERTFPKKQWVRAVASIWLLQQKLTIQPSLKSRYVHSLN